MRRRVAVTGLGCLSPLGNETSTTWTNLLNGVSGIGPITFFDAVRFPVRIAGELKEFDPYSVPLPDALEGCLNRAHQMGVVAAMEAVSDAGGLNAVAPERTGVAVGISGHYPTFEEILEFAGTSSSAEWEIGRFYAEMKTNPRWSILRSGNTLPAVLARIFNALGPNIGVHTACASGSNAIGEAMLAIRRGEADLMIAGGIDALASPIWVIGFMLLGALSSNRRPPDEVSRPFDKARDGFVIGEASVILVLEELECALRRGSKIYAFLDGYGTSVNAFRITDAPEDGRVPAIAIEKALKSAGIEREKVGYIHAHGTSTQMNDISETNAIRRVFGDLTDRIHVSATKSMTGHAISASGPLGALAAIKVLETGRIPPTTNLHHPDSNCRLNHVANQSQRARVFCAMVNAFGFGGQNAILVFQHKDQFATTTEGGELR